MSTDNEFILLSSLLEASTDCAYLKIFCLSACFSVVLQEIL